MAKNFFGITDTGRQRTNNEDTFIAEEVLKGQYIMACVIDGVGGYSGGEVAAATARQSILEYFSVPSGDVVTMLKEALISANKKIYKERQKGTGNNEMACVLTIAMADVKNKIFHYAHVGDTRLYLFRDASLIKVTKDHSFVGFLEDSGRLSEDGAMNHPKRNEINKALGFDDQIVMGSDYIETGSSPFLPGDLLLLCSDGLTDMVNKAEITALLTNGKTLDEQAKALVDAANNRGGKDNITVVLVSNNEKPIKLKATKPKVVKKKVQQSEPQKSEIQTVAEPIKKPSSTNKRLYIISSFIGLALLIIVGLIWYLNKKPKNNVIAPVVVAESITQPQLQDSINRFSGTVFILNDSLIQQPFILTDTLFVAKDSLHLKGLSNFIFKSDSLYKGPALLAFASNFLVLENITFQDFDMGILMQNKKLQLKNVRFVNCKVPLHQSWLVPSDRLLNGLIADTIFIKTDSLHKHSK